jgi:hypothetical protein
MFCNQKLATFVSGQKFSPDGFQSDVAGSSPGGAVANSLDMSNLLLSAVGKSDGSAADLLLRWRQETACEMMSERLR